MVGRTVGEVAAISGRAVREALQASQTVQQPQQQYVAPRQALTPPDPDLMISNHREYHQQLMAYNEAVRAQELAQAAQPFVSVTAQLSADASRRDPKWQNVWSRYGPEIESLVAANTQHAPAARASKDLWDQAAEIVQGRHYQELAEDLVQRRMASQPTLERGGSVAGGVPQTPVDKLDELWQGSSAWVRSCKENDISPAMIRAHCEKRGIPIEDYVAQVQRAGMIRSEKGFKTFVGNNSPAFKAQGGRR